MKLRSALNNGFLTMGLSSVIVGLVKVRDFSLLTFAPFLVFFIFFRVKMWLDDSAYFSETARKNKWFDVGIVLAVVAWSLWAIAGYSIDKPSVSYTYCCISLGFLCLWIVADAIHGGQFGKDRPRFLVTNLFYMLILFLISREDVSLPFNKDILLYILVIGTVADILWSGSLEVFKEE